MVAELSVLFPPFRLDLVAGKLWREDHLIPLRPKPLALLRYLIEQHGRMISATDIFRAVWPGTVVGRGALKVRIRELRVALGEDAKQPRFIETVPGQGYRWIAETRDWGLEASPPPQQVSSLKSQVPSLVGREAELEQLHRLLETARGGERQLVFIAGEPGIGKTTLVDAFLARLETRDQNQEENQKAKGKNQKAKIEDQPPTPSPKFVDCSRAVH